MKSMRFVKLLQRLGWTHMFNDNFFNAYIKYAPLPLAVERTQECLLISRQKLEHPILDLGCGDGIFARILFKTKIDVGIDPNLNELKRAENTGKYSELINCYGDKIPKPDKSFKTIFSNSVMEHISDIKPVLKEAHRLLDDNGKLYLTLPTHLFDKYTFGYQILKALKLKKPMDWFSLLFNNFWCHYHFYTSEEWRNLFSEAGFTVDFEQEYGTKKICMFNDLMAVFSLPSLFARKILNRWFWFDSWRQKYAKLMSFLVPIHFRRIETEPGKGGLIFFVLTKHA